MAEDSVKFKLAHPLPSADAAQLGLERRVHNVGEELTLPRRDAMRLVASGMVEHAEPSRPETLSKAFTRANAVEQAAPAGTPTAATPTKPGKTAS
ncbi:hypothetical protein ACQP25_45005 (plasmid) [Microtetraspora malaysiensis]|uniref:hypothetical protein n=1 Tax=Microtetraspora malaysiensis TaxID=161358 RepID=UPI003D8D3B91